ncbi:MAG: NUDIX hydrolase [Candidatus Tyrphobacter sp.]
MSVRPASTVMLVREAGARGIEVFMLRRSEKSAFAPNVYVFPGGTVDATDRDAGARTSHEELRRLFRMDSPPGRELQAGLVAAARRELLEEAGVRLPGAEPLELFSRWITPTAITPRYDVFFFVARMPEGQTPVADATETHDGLWLTPADALARSDAGDLRVIYPTRKHLERLRGFPGVAELLAFARTKPILTVLAEGTERDGFALPRALEGGW